MRPAAKLSRSCLILGAIVALASARLDARSQEERPLGQITVYTSASDDDARLKGRPVMITILGKGGFASQSEVEIGSVKIFAYLPVGLYEVRAEGEGMGTVVKRGVAVTHKGDTELRFPMRSGRGVKVVEYYAT